MSFSCLVLPVAIVGARWRGAILGEKARSQPTVGIPPHSKQSCYGCLADLL
jgi:hypothetical protein